MPAPAPAASAPAAAKPAAPARSAAPAKPSIPIPEVSSAPPAAPPPSAGTPASPPGEEVFGAPLGSGPAALEVRKALRKKAGVPESIVAPEEDGAAPQPAAPEGEEPSGTSLPADAPPDIRDKKTGKVNPWKLSSYWKEKHRELEGQLAEAKRNALPEEETRKLREGSETMRKRISELENELYFHDYSQHPDFKDKFQKPYEQAWQRAMSDLSEITVNGADGETRAVTPQDILELVNMPLGQAREVANELFGDFADDVMAHRKEIRRLADDQANALQSARKNAGERARQIQETQAKMRQHIADEWAKANAEITGDEKFGDFFKDRDGDEAWNSRLKKGFDFVDKAWKENPLRPGLKPEEVRNIVRRHAALRNRAASWGAIRGENDALRARISELEKELGQFQESTPGGGSPRSGEAPAGPRKASEEVFAALRSKAR